MAAEGRRRSRHSLDCSRSIIAFCSFSTCNARYMLMLLLLLLLLLLPPPPPPPPLLMLLLPLMLLKHAPQHLLQCVQLRH